jgi:hypothetical protein
MEPLQFRLLLCIWPTAAASDARRVNGKKGDMDHGVSGESRQQPASSRGSRDRFSMTFILFGGK